MSNYDSFSHSRLSSHFCVEVSQDEEFVCGANLLQEVLQVAVEGLLCSSFSVQSWCVHSDDSCKLVVLVWESQEHEAVRTTNWQVLQFSGNGSFDHECNKREVALVLVFPRPEEGLTCYVLLEGALSGKAYFAESTNIDVQPS